MNRINTFFVFIGAWFGFIPGIASSELSALEKLGFERTGFSANEILIEPARFLNKEISVSGILAVDRDIRIYEDVKAINNLSYVRVDSRYFSELSSYDGCFVSVSGVFKKIYKDRHLMYLTKISDIERTGFYYFSASNLMKERGIEGSPQCYLKVVVELMATPNNLKNN